MVLPSLADALIVIILLIPGFITFTIIRWLGKYGDKLTEFNITISSFSLSMVIIFIYMLITGTTSLDILRDNFFNPSNFSILFGITLAIGLCVGLTLRHLRSNYVRGNTWKNILTETKDTTWVIVMTKMDVNLKAYSKWQMWKKLCFLIPLYIHAIKMNHTSNSNSSLVLVYHQS